MSFKVKPKEPAIVKSIRLPKNLSDFLDRLAAKNNISFNEIVVRCIHYAKDNLEDIQD